MFRPIVVIPVYNHDIYLPTLVGEIVRMELPCLLVDDGSDIGCAAVIDALQARYPKQVAVVRHDMNQGKGAAVLSGFKRALSEGYTHGVQIDADGQHTITDMPLLVRLARENPTAMVTGQPIFDESVPLNRLYFRYLTHYMVSINTLTFHLRDAMCGFRVYPLAITLKLDERVHLGRRMDFDIDALVRLDWAGVPIVLQKTKVRYPVDGVSHFRLFADNARITKMHTHLFFGMLIRVPKLLFRRRTSTGTSA
ncbi:MAG: glycosyltransferase family 2 protein [Phycisphaerae bacterium]|nr:glycosyltransferase family 2 protein [Gemmatimonadaceae bacterium]